MKRFEIGQTYGTRSACNHDCIFRYTVTRRTEKFLFLDDGHGNIQRRGVTVWDGIETCKPEGSYSMAPVIDADGSRIDENGEITSEARNRARMEEIQNERQPERLDEVPPIVSDDVAREIISDLTSAGFTREQLLDMTHEQIVREWQARRRRAAFHVVAA